MFELHLHTCNLGSAVRLTANPFTGEPIEVPLDVGLTAEQQSAVRALLVEAGAEEPDPDGYRRVRLPDGAIISVLGPPDEEWASCVALAVECRALTQGVADFVHKLAQRGEMAVMVVPQVVALPSLAPLGRVARRWPSAVVVESPGELFGWLRENLGSAEV